MSPTSTPPTSNPIADQVVRVFVSSTFRDLEAERDELAKQAFPALRRFCEHRGLTWSDVDLRWGITDEQASENHVLEICLREITKCRPYFIGILGERYGWVPDAIPVDLLARVPWLTNHAGASVTELEILHGVLRRKDAVCTAFFYFRDARHTPRDPHAREGVIDDEVRRFGRAEAERRASERRARLHDLKQRIRNSGAHVREFRTPGELAVWVERDLKAAIEADLPHLPTDPTVRAAHEHESFGKGHAPVAVARPEVRARLDATLAQPGPPLVVVGSPGSGKTGLLSRWWHDPDRAVREVPGLTHHVGANAESTQWRDVVRRCLLALQAHLGVDGEVPAGASELRQAFTVTMQRVEANRPFALIIDGLDQLEEGEGAQPLAWLPRQLPPGIRCVLATSGGLPLAAVQQRQWPVVVLGDLGGQARATFTRDYLARFGKALGDGLVQQVAAAPSTGNLRYLRTVLDELRVHGVHETVANRASELLRARTTADLYDRVLARWEQDYERDRPGLVRDAFRLLVTARRGLREPELLDLLGSDQDLDRRFVQWVTRARRMPDEAESAALIGRATPLPQRVWAPLSHAASGVLTLRSGLLHPTNRDFRNAVNQRYLTQDREQAHRLLGGYFGAQAARVGVEAGEATDAAMARMQQEQPWHLAAVREWQGLAGMLDSPVVASGYWEHCPRDLQSLWVALEWNTPLRVEQVYSEVVENPHDFCRVRPHMVGLLAAMGRHRAIVAMADRGLSGSVGLHEALDLLVARAAALVALGDVNRVLKAVEEAEEYCKSLDDLYDLVSDKEVAGPPSKGELARHEKRRQCQLIRAQTAWLLGDPAQAATVARACLAEALRWFDEPVQAACSIVLAGVAGAAGDLQAAMAYHQDAERLAQSLEDEALLGQLAEVVADIFARWGRSNDVAKALDRAAVFYTRAGHWAAMERIATRRGGPTGTGPAKPTEFRSSPVRADSPAPGTMKCLACNQSFPDSAKRRKFSLGGLIAGTPFADVCPACDSDRVVPDLGFLLAFTCPDCGERQRVQAARGPVGMVTVRCRQCGAMHEADGP